LDEHVEDQLAAFALGILEPAEALEVTSHLRTCHKCQVELQAYDDVAQVLPLATPLHEPPAGLKQAVLDRLEPANRKSPARAPSPWWQRLIPASWTSTPVWGVVSLLLIVALGAVNLALWNRLQGQAPQSGTSLQTIILQSTNNSPEATGLMVVGGDGRVGSLIVDHLPPSREGQQYQLWLIRSDGRDSGGVFTVDEEGYGVLYMHTETPLLSYAGFGITIEPEGGSPSPTGEKVLGFDF
jgi:anti-sigma-K factor RskA